MISSTAITRGKVDIPRLIFGKRLWVGTRPGHASGGVTAARPGEAAPVLLFSYAAAAVTTDGKLGFLRVSLVGWLHNLLRRGHHFSNLNSPVTGDGNRGRPRDIRGLVALGRELRVPRLEHNVTERGTLLLLALELVVMGRRRVSESVK